jgi:hypothetical protein
MAWYLWVFLWQLVEIRYPAKISVWVNGNLN